MSGGRGVRVRVLQVGRCLVASGRSLPRAARRLVWTHPSLSALRSYLSSFLVIHVSPEKPSLKAGEARFYHYDIYYILPGHDEEALAVARDFVALFKAKGIAQGYRIFTVVTGPEMPALVVEVPARDGADYYATDAAARAALGEAGKALFARALAVTRRLEHRNAMLRPDLSPTMWPPTE